MESSVDRIAFLERVLKKIEPSRLTAPDSTFEIILESPVVLTVVGSIVRATTVATLLIY